MPNFLIVKFSISKSGRDNKGNKRKIGVKWKRKDAPNGSISAGLGRENKNSGRLKRFRTQKNGISASLSLLYC